MSEGETPPQGSIDQQHKWGTWSGGKDISKVNISRRDFLRGSGEAAKAVIAQAVITNPLIRASESFAQGVDAKNEQLQTYTECEYTLGDDFLELRTKLPTNESKDLRIVIEHKNLPITESNYRPTESEIVIDDRLNPNFNCHSFTLEQVADITGLGAESNVWIEDPEMKKVLDTYGQEVFDSGYYNEDGFSYPKDLKENDVLALIDHNGELQHTGIYHTQFNGLDTQNAPYISKFGGGKLMARNFEAVIDEYWINQPNDTDQLKMKVYRFDETFDFSKT